MKKRQLIRAILFFLGLSTSLQGFSQSAPAEDENIPYLVTFGGNSDRGWGDDDFCQIFFFSVPKTFNSPFYIRVFDPDTGGEIDEQKGEFNTTTKFSVYGGNGAWSNDDARAVDPIGNFESGNLLDSKTFNNNSKYDQKWYTFGPFNALEGEYSEKLDGYIFKVIARGIEGDDGNLYTYFLSTNKEGNKSIEGGNVFTYEYTFRLSNNQNNVSQIYPFLDGEVTSVKIMNFDWDEDGFIRVVSVAKRGELVQISDHENWVSTVLPISTDERNTSMEVQFIKNRTEKIKNNNVINIFCRFNV